MRGANHKLAQVKICGEHSRSQSRKQMMVEERNKESNAKIKLRVGIGRSKIE